MKFVKILLGIFVTLAVLFVIGGMLLPTEQHVERSVVVKADPAKVFSLVNDFREFNKWSPWAAYDPEGTRLTWSFDANLDSMVGRYMGLMMDKWVGSDYEGGLARLKELAET